MQLQFVHKIEIPGKKPVPDKREGIGGRRWVMVSGSKTTWDTWPNLQISPECRYSIVHREFDLIKKTISQQFLDLDTY